MAIGSVEVDVKNSVGEPRERVASSVGSSNLLFQGRFRVPGAFSSCGYNHDLISSLYSACLDACLGIVHDVNIRGTA